MKATTVSKMLEPKKKLPTLEKYFDVLVGNCVQCSIPGGDDRVYMVIKQAIGTALSGDYYLLNKFGEFKPWSDFRGTELGCWGVRFAREAGWGEYIEEA